ncbi:MAG: methylated-DNA--[protein]-cysteine S-methyltransferase [Alphaproteobacteria bacterium]
MSATASLSIASPVGRLTLSERDEALIKVNWGAPEGSDRTALLKEAAIQLDGYFTHEINEFTLKLNPIGTIFQVSVWVFMVNITFGDLATYGELAQTLGGSARSVGTACGRNPIPIIIPCHRVVAANGRLGGFSGGAGSETKRALITHEGAAHRGPLGLGDKPVQTALW